MLLLTKQEVQQLLDPFELLAALEAGFKAISTKAIDVPGRSQVKSSHGVLLTMPASMPGLNMSIKLVSIFHENKTLPSHQALISLFDSNTGAPLALMDGTLITTMRTAISSMISIRLLARQSAKQAAIIGSGVQALAHLRMMVLLTPIEQINIASRQVEKAIQLAHEVNQAQAVESTQAAISGADVICLCTSSNKPVLMPEWLKKGAHITSVGYNPPGGELPRDVIENSHLFVESRHAFAAPPAGSAELQGLDSATGTELGEVLLHTRPGRHSDNETTVYKSMGHAMEDMVAANLVYQKALSRKMGTEFYP